MSSGQASIISYKTWKTGNINLVYACSDFTECSKVETGNDKDLLRLHFGLSGDYSFTYKELGKTFLLAGGHHNLMYSKGISLGITAKTNIIETFGISFPPSELFQLFHQEDHFCKSFLQKIEAGEACIFSERWGRINSAIQKLIHEILNHNYTGNLEAIFLQAKTLELLVLCLDNYRSLTKSVSGFLKSQEDKEKIIAVRDLLNRRLINPPTIKEVAQLVGLNEFKLKNGFKEFFGCTMFNYLTERRLHEARQYLLNTSETAAEIAYKMGYSSPQHFNRQFKKRFGHTPDFIRKNP